MKKLNSALLLASVVIFGSITCAAQGRINLVNGRRVVSDQVSFVVDVDRLKQEHPRFATAPENMQIYVVFGRPATGVVYLDGKAMTRFDESAGFTSNPVDISYGRHVMTFKFAGPAELRTFMVTVNGGMPHEILEGELKALTHSSGFEDRIVELERKVTALEAQIATLKKRPL